jgi:bacillithiol system protein YtxJ
MIDDIRDDAGIDEALGRPAAFIFKHSTRCPVSARAATEIRRFVDGHPEVPVHRVLVIDDRPLSMAIAGRLGVIHESPQAILVRDGAPVWTASHDGVTAEALERAWSEGGKPGEQAKRTP